MLIINWCPCLSVPTAREQVDYTDKQHNNEVSELIRGHGTYQLSLASSGGLCIAESPDSFHLDGVGCGKKAINSDSDRFSNSLWVRVLVNAANSL